MTDPQLEKQIDQTKLHRRPYSLDQKMDQLFEQHHERQFRHRMLWALSLAAVLIIGLGIMVVVLLQMNLNLQRQPSLQNHTPQIVKDGQPQTPYHIETVKTEELYRDTVMQDGVPVHEIEIKRTITKYYVDENNEKHLQDSPPPIQETLFVPATFE